MGHFDQYWGCTTQWIKKIIWQIQKRKQRNKKTFQSNLDTDETIEFGFLDPSDDVDEAIEDDDKTIWVVFNGGGDFLRILCYFHN